MKVYHDEDARNEEDKVIDIIEDAAKLAATVAHGRLFSFFGFKELT